MGERISIKFYPNDEKEGKRLKQFNIVRLIFYIAIVAISVFFLMEFWKVS
jgi:hypothetical protein